MKLSISWSELLLLDWLICESMQNMGQEHLEWLIDGYGSLRRRIWETVLLFPTDATKALLAPEQSIVLEGEAEAQLLLTIIPTTFRFAAGPDLGLSLKTKLAAALWGPSEEQRAATAAVEEAS